MHLHWRFSSVLHTASVLRISSVLHTASVLRRLLVYYTPQVCHTSPLQCITHHQSITHCKCIIHSSATSVLHFSHSIYEEQPLQEIRPLIRWVVTITYDTVYTCNCILYQWHHTEVQLHCSHLCITHNCFLYAAQNEMTCAVSLPQSIYASQSTCLCITLYLPHRHSV